jgi:hypothetical protein
LGRRCVRQLPERVNLRHGSIRERTRSGGMRRGLVPEGHLIVAQHEVLGLEFGPN